MMYDFTLFYEDCKEKFSTFDDFADACENLYNVAVDYDNEDATFYDFAFSYDTRENFVKDSLDSGKNYKAMAQHQIKCQQAFRNSMSMFF